MIAEKERESGRVLERIEFVFTKKKYSSVLPLYNTPWKWFSRWFYLTIDDNHASNINMFRMHRWFSFSSIDLRISRDTGNLKEYFALEIELKNARILLRRPFGLFLCLICPERGRKSALRIAQSSNEQNRSESIPLVRKCSRWEACRLQNLLLD